MVTDKQGREVSTYARWPDINRVIKPLLTKHGFGLRFRTAHGDGRVEVTCLLHHLGGHVEETTLSFPVDLSGGKNDVQAIGSSTSYGKRYTASALLNLTSDNEDDDGRAAGKPRCISSAQLSRLRELIQKTGSDEARLAGLFDVGAIDELPASVFDDAIASLEARGRRQSK